MNLEQKIILGKVGRIEQLTPVEQARVRAEPRLMQVLAENKALAGITPASKPAPDRDTMISRVYREAGNKKETSMTLVNRLFTGKRWYVQATIAAALILALGALALFPRTVSWASTDGYVLVFDFGQVGAPGEDDGMEDIIHEQLEALHKAVQAWKESLETENGDMEDEVHLMLNVNVDGGNMIATIGIAGAEDELLEDLRSSLSDVPGLPEPTVSDATWFYDGAEPDIEHSISFNINDHQFSFPKDATEEEIEEQINSWIKEQHPDQDFKVDVDVERDGEQVMIKVKLLSGEAEG